MLTLILKDITDPIIRENFFRISNFVAQNPLIGTDFKFIEVDIPQKNYAYPVPHGLKFTPTDIIPLAAEGDFNYYFRTDESDATNVYVASDGPVRLRFLAGRINQTGRRPLNDNQLPFVSPTADVSGTVTGSDGWVFLQDSAYTSSSPLTLTAGTRTLLPNNQAGSLTNFTQSPTGGTSWWNATNSIFQGTKLGEFYTLKVNFIIVPSVAGKSGLFEVDIGNNTTSVARDFTMARGAGSPIRISQTVPLAMSPSAFNNGVRFYVTSDCQASVYNLTLTIVRDYHL